MSDDYYDYGDPAPAPVYDYGGPEPEPAPVYDYGEPEPEPEPEPAPVYDYGDPAPSGNTGGFTGGESQDHDLTDTEALTGQGWTQDELGNYYKIGPNNEYSFIGSDGKTYNYDTTKGGFTDAQGKLAGGATATSLAKSFKKLFEDKDGKLDYTKLLPMLGGLYGASQSNNRTQPSGYQGKIPTYTATRQAPGIGELLSGNALFRTPDTVTTNADGTQTTVPGKVINPNTAAPSTGIAPPKEDVVTKAKGGALESGGFVIPADVVSHLGNGSSEAGLRLLAQRYGAAPIKGKGDGMSDSIRTTIDGRQPARVANEEARLTKSQVQAAGGAQKLYAMMAKIREARTGSKEQGRQIDPRKYMPGGSVNGYAGGGVTLPTGTTGTESNLSNWAGDYVTNMLGKGQALSEMPYEQYKGPLTAGPSALQTQAFNTAGNLQTPSAIGQAANTAGNIAGTAQNMAYTPTQFGTQFQAPAAYQTGQFSSQFTAPTQTATTQFNNQFQNAPAPYQTGTFGTDTFDTQQAQQYMNPYLQAALEPQLAEARRQADISRMADAGRLTNAGAYGGGRQAIMESEGRRNLGTKLSDITGQGYNTAFTNAMSQFNADQARRQTAQAATEQSRQFGAGQNMTAAQLQAQYGLSAQQAQEAARQFNQGQNMTAAQLQAQYGLSAQQAQEASRQFGANQGITAAQLQAQYGLAGQQATEASKQFGANYGLQGLQTGLQAAQAQGQLGATQQQAGINNIKTLADLGATQQGLSQADIAAQKAAFEEARLNPYKMVQFQQSLLSGLPLAAQTYNQAPTDNLTQFANTATTIDKLLKTLGQN